MPKFLENNVLERTAADLVTYLRSDTCPFSSVVKQALYDAIFQYSIMAVESRRGADRESQTRKSNFGERFDSICKLPTKERELVLKESEALLEVLYDALIEDSKGQLSARALMQSLHKRVSELTSLLRTERTQHKQEIKAVSEKLEEYKADNKAEMAEMEKRLSASFVILFSDQADKLREAERLRDEALGPDFDFKKERNKLVEDYSNRLLDNERKIKQLETQLQTYRNVNVELQSSNSTKDTLNKKIAQLSAEVDGLKVFRANATEKAEKQQEQIDGWGDEKKHLTKERNQFERKFKTLETEVGTLGGKLAYTESTLEEMSKDFAKAKADLTSNQDALAANQATYEAALLGVCLPFYLLLSFSVTHHSAEQNGFGNDPLPSCR